MSMICKNCGEKLDEKANYCLICGEPVKREKMPDQEDYQWSMSLKEVIDSEFSEAQKQTGIRVESKSENKSKKRKMKIQTKINKKEHKNKEIIKKKSKLGMILFIIIGVVVIALGGTLFGISTGIINPNLVPLIVVNKIAPIDDLHISAKLVEGVTEEGQPIGNEMSGYSVNTKSFTVFGSVENEAAGTPINICWEDKTEGIDMYDQVVYLNESGEFYATIATNAIGYEVKGVTRPGDYSVTIVVDDKVDMPHKLSFKVLSGSFEAGEVDYINDIYMVKKIDEESFQAVKGYDENPEDILLEISYINAPADTKLIDKWYFEAKDWEEIEFAEPLDYWVLTEATKSHIIDLPPLTPVNGWKTGNYRVELYTEDNQLAGATEFYVNNSQPIAQDKKETTSETINISEIYLTEDKVGNTIVESISSDAKEVFCYYYLQGVISKTKLTWVLGENNTGQELTHQTNIVNKNGKYLIEIASGDLDQVLEPKTYYISIYEGEYQEDAQQLANIVFEVIDDEKQAITVVEEGKILTYEEAKWMEWNDWLTIFTDSRMPELYLTTKLTKDQLIDFAVLRNYIGQHPDMIESLDNFGMFWLSEPNVNYTIDWLLDEDKIDDPKSTDLVYYDAGSYGIEQSKIETLPKRFAQVTKAYEASDNYYILYFNVYEAPYDFDGDVNGDEAEWKTANTQPTYLGEMMATYEEVTDPELGMRWILRAFHWREQIEEAS